jgi:hypothetical protein
VCPEHHDCGCHHACQHHDAEDCLLASGSTRRRELPRLWDHGSENQHCVAISDTVLADELGRASYGSHGQRPHHTLSRLAGSGAGRGGGDDSGHQPGHAPQHSATAPPQRAPARHQGSHPLDQEKRGDKRADTEVQRMQLEAVELNLPWACRQKRGRCRSGDQKA